MEDTDEAEKPKLSQEFMKPRVMKHNQPISPSDEGKPLVKLTKLCIFCLLIGPIADGAGPCSYHVAK
jgi:hypothetical protein